MRSFWSFLVSGAQEIDAQFIQTDLKEMPVTQEQRSIVSEMDTRCSNAATSLDKLNGDGYTPSNSNLKVY